MGNRNIIAVNGSDRRYSRHNYILWFGTVGTTYLRVWSNSLEDALEQAAEWLADNGCKGHFCDDTVTEAYNEAIAEGHTQEQAWDLSSEDCTYTESGYLDSSEWGIIAEDPSRATVLELMTDTY